MKILNEKTARVLWVLLSALSLALSPVAAAGEPHIFGNVGYYVPEDAGDRICGSAGCLELDSGFGFQGGVGYDIVDIVAAEVGGLYASGDITGSQGLPNGDWSVQSWLVGIRLQSPQYRTKIDDDGDEVRGEQYDEQVYARVGASFWDSEVDIGGVKADGDGTDIYFGLGGRWHFLSASWFHQDGDNMFSAGVEIPLSL